LFLLLVSASLAVGQTNQLITDGNSITHGTGETPWPDMVLTNLGNPWGVTNVAQSGQDTRQRIVDLNANYSVFPNKNSSATWKLVNMLEGGNSIAHGSNAVQAYSDLTNYCGLVTNNGQLPIICTVFPRGDLTGTSDTYRTMLNSNIMTNWNTFAFGVINFATNTLLDFNVNPSNFQSDHIHPTTSGAFAIANQAADAIRAMIAIPNGSNVLSFSGKVTLSGKVGQ
jgi:hypothetical protein